MTTKSHKTLTGNQLHEPKGADAAAADKVYVSDGAGSGVWQKLTTSQLTGTGNSFGGQLFHVREEQTSGVNSTGSLSSGSWNIRVLNTTKTNEISSASLTSNQISLPAGTYYVKAISPVALTGGSINTSALTKLALYNVTGSAYLILGPSDYQSRTFASINAVLTQTFVNNLEGRFTLAGTTTIELRQYMTGSGTGGTAIGSGQVEVYSEVFIWKVA